MKTIALTLFSAFTILSTASLQAQGSCVVINNGSFRIITNSPNPCSRNATFTFVNPTNGARRIKVDVIVGTTIVLSDCHDASGQPNVTRTYTSAAFTACNLAVINVMVTPFNGNNCNGSGCSATLLSIGGSPLPVTFSTFIASRNSQSVMLKWETATENNNSGFVIERNTKGQWEQIGFTATLAPNGNSNQILGYQFIDQNSNKGMSQYRLKQVDINGAARYSEVRAVRGTAQEAKTTVFPNPSANGQVNVVFSDASIRDIQLSDMAGRILKQWTAFNGNSLQLSGLSTGLFSLRISNRETGQLTSEKIIVTGK